MVIPVRNGAETLAAQLSALASATPPSVAFEVLIADNGSTDDTLAVARSYSDRLELRVVDASRARGINVARNCGVRAAIGDVVLLCDSDDEVDVDWLTAMERAFNDGHQLVGGPIDYRRLNPAEVRAWRGADQARVTATFGFLPAAHGANLGFTRSLFEAVAGFDESFVFGGEDTEFCWRAQLAGFGLFEVSDAVVHYRLRPSLRAFWRQNVSYGQSEVLLYRTFSRDGMQRRSPSKLLSEPWWLLTRLPFAWPVGRRGAWLRRLGSSWGRMKGVVKYRALWW